METKKWWVMTTVITWHKFDCLHNEPATFLFFENLQDVSKAMINQLLISFRKNLGNDRSKVIDTLQLHGTTGYPPAELINLSFEWGWIKIGINSLNSNGTLNKEEAKMIQKHFSKLLLETFI